MSSAPNSRLCKQTTVRQFPVL